MLLLSNMINTRTCIRLLRHLGIALIFAPEPFTTPFGVASILVARHLSKRHEAGVNNRLRETIQYYLAHTGRFGEYVDCESAAPSRAKRRGLNEERPILGEITGSRGVQAKSSVRQPRSHTEGGTANHTTETESLSRRYKYRDSLSGTSTGTQRVIHHTIDMEWLSRRYESANGAVAHSGWATTCDAGEGITHHSIQVGSLPQNCRSGSVGETKAKSRAVNVAQRRGRYGSAVSYATVARALQNNNYRYDILSRRNVIGGY
jgi:hypothetical protein